MILYNRNVEPPAPFLDVTIEHPTTGQRLPLPAKLDTGADISAIPATVVEQLHLLPVRAISVEGYDNYARLNGPDLTFDLSLSSRG